MLWLPSKGITSPGGRNFTLQSLFYCLPLLPKSSELSLFPEGRSGCCLHSFRCEHTYSHRTVLDPCILRRQLKSCLPVGCVAISGLGSPIRYYLVTIIIIPYIYIIFITVNALAFSELILHKPSWERDIIRY